MWALRRYIRFRNHSLAVELGTASGAGYRRAGMRRLILRRSNIRRTLRILYL
jgi:hypothetical protein